MLLPTNLTNRRQFLERTALGAGSVLFLQGLLNGCTDHRIPDPGTPGVVPPVVGAGDGPTFDVNDDLKIVVTNGLNKVPIVGEILSTLLEILWPESQQDVWSQVKEQVEEVIDQKISAAALSDLEKDLEGLQNTIILYVNETKYGNATTQLSLWLSVRTTFAQALPHFKLTKPTEINDAILTLPMFAQFANMHLSILRDGVIAGKKWGVPDADVGQYTSDLKNAIHTYSTYVQDTAEAGYANLKGSTPQDGNQCEPFKTLNAYERKITLTALDYTVSWPYYDVTEYPNGGDTKLTRQIYSDVVGTCFGNSTPQELSTMHPNPKLSVPTQFPTQITVWGNETNETIVATQVTYPAGGGPNGVTQYRKGDPRCVGTSDGPYGGTVPISDPAGNPIVKVIYNTDQTDGINDLAFVTVQFVFANGAQSPMFGGKDTSLDRQKTDWLEPVPVSFTNHALSLIHANGYSDGCDSNIALMAGVALGFKYWEHPTSTSRALRFLYIRSPQDQSVAEFVSALSNKAVAANSIGVETELNEARQAYWASIKARAK